MKIERALNLLAALTLLLALALGVASYDLRAYEERSFTVYDREGNLLSYGLTHSDSLRFDCTVEEVDPLYLKMLLASEDKRFYAHPGVDPLALLRALWGDLVALRVTSGASTLAMQVMRTLTHNPRTLRSKFQEALGALLLTLKEGREQVLRLYLTLAPFGSNLEGVKAASLKWFGHLPSHLTPAEAALLVALPRAPEAIRPDRHPAAALYYRNEVLRLAVKEGVIKPDILAAATSEPLPEKILELPRRAYQLGLYAYKLEKGPEISTLISPMVQDILLRTAQHYAKSHTDGSTLSAVVVDARDHSIAGYLASASLKDSYLDLPHALRSPGSALKPFIYALAFEQHLLHPKTVVADLKTLYGTWEPRNYSRSFQGEISAAQALCLSLNLPALRVLARVDPTVFLARLNSGRPRIYLPYGASAQLALALGGCGISLLDLTDLYAMLNQDGIFTRSRIFPEDEGAALPLLQPQAARAVFETLKMTQRPPAYLNALEVSYKTGTSYGYRDALALGSLGPYTVGVWTGKPDNTPNPGQTGYLNAAPCLFEILSRLQDTSWFKPRLAPTDALSEDAPLALKRLYDKGELRLDPHRLRLLFPLGGEIISPDSEGYIQLRFEGGIPPLHLTVNGRSCPDPTCFKPTQNGEYHLSLLDSAGHAVSADIKVVLRPEDQDYLRSGGSAAP